MDRRQLFTNWVNDPGAPPKTVAGGVKATLSRRRFVQAGITFTSLALANERAIASIGGAGRAMGGIGSGGAGFYPAGHWIAAKQAMIQVYPRPDTESSANARHHWAYWDGVNAIQYSVPIGVSFGAYPYVFELLSGPPGMTVAQPIYNGFQNENFGRLIWTPQGNISSNWSGTVEVLVTDQQHNTLTISFALQTSSSQFIFVDSVHGSDSNAGTIGAPFQTMSKVFGSTYAATANAELICYARQGSYTLPIFADAPWVANCFQWHTSAKPIALIGYPGETASFPVPTGNATAYLTCSGQTGNDMFFQSLAFSGYDATQSSYVLMWFAGNDRLVFDQISWSGAGYGTTGTGNATMIHPDSASPTSANYLFITDSSESGRQSGTPGNNFAFCDIYTFSKFLVQRSSAVNASANINGAFFAKSDCANGCLRENFVNFAGAGYCFGGEQAVIAGAGYYNCEYCYNKVINGNIFNPHNNGGNGLGINWSYRNSCIGALACESPNAGGPFVFDSNAAQTATALPSGTSVQTDGLNVLAASGLLDSTACNLTGTYANPPSGGGVLGTVGAQISATA